jgi:hypothetical protein
MRKLSLLWVAAPAMIVVSACSNSPRSSADDALRNDLALAAQAYAPQQFTSPAEQMPASYVAPRAATPVRTVARATAAPRRTTTQSSSAGTIYSPAPAPTQERVVKHTKRDAAIGAAAGAVIGAATSRDKVKGGLIGAAVGGIIGGVIGNNVDVKRTRY